MVFVSKKVGKKTLSLDVPFHLHVLLKKVAAEHGVTATTIIVKYLEYLQKMHPSMREPFDAESEPRDFSLDG